MSTYDVTVTGPSPRLAMLAALIHKIADTGQTAWATGRTLIAGATRHGRTLAHTTLAVIGSPTGYQLAITSIRTLITTGWLGLKAAATWMSRTAGRTTDKATGLIGTVSPGLAEQITLATSLVTQRVARGANTAASWVETAGELVWMLATTDLVRTCTTRAAMAAVTLISVHAVTQGALAAKLVAALPWTMDAVIAVTNPTRALVFVVGTMLIAMGVAAARLAKQIGPVPPAAAAEATAAATEQEAERHLEVLTDLTVIAGKVTIEVQRDGSVLVTGIPDTVPDDLGQAVAEIALDAATRHIRRTLPVRPNPSRDDRRLFTKAARDAIRAEAARRKEQAAA